MKRFDENLEVTVFRYDLMRPSDWDRDCDEELSKMTAMWNRLCVVHREHIAAVRAVGAPAAAAVEAEAEQIGADLEARIDERKAKRKAARSKHVSPELDTHISDLSKRLNELRKTAKELRKTAYQENKDKLKTLDGERYAKVKKVYQTSGLFWSNYNCVVGMFDRARGPATKKGAELHERRFNGEGRFFNQIQNGMTVGRLLAGTHSQLAILPKPEWMRHKDGATLRFLVWRRDGNARYVHWPFVKYRPLPEDALIKEAAVTRRRVGDQWRYAVIFTLTRKRAETAPTTGPVTAINLGWRKTPGGLLVATAVSEEDGYNRFQTRTAELNCALLHGFERQEQMQSVRAGQRNALVERLRKINEWPESLAEPAGKLSEQIVRSGDLHRLMDSWRKLAPEWNRPELKILELWWNGSGLHKRPKAILHDPEQRFAIFGEHGAQCEQATRWQHLRNARLYHYRMEAHQLIGNASLVIINQHDMAETAKRKDNELAPPARRNRIMAAPSILRRVLLDYCRKRGIEVRVFEGDSHDHWACGRAFETPLPDEAQRLCRHCHEYFDVDENFCRLMLKRTARPTRRKAA